MRTLQKYIPDFPRLNINYLSRLTSSVGLMQHGKYTLPNYEHGYCLDDNSRAMLLLTMVNRVSPSPRSKELLGTYLSYINYMQLENGKFRNFLSMDHKFLDSEGTEDSFGRTIQALGFNLKHDKGGDFNEFIHEIFLKALPHCRALNSIRAVAYCLLGLSDYYQSYPENKNVETLIQELTEFLLKEYKLAKDGEWHWYEQIITYDNAIIPLSLLRSATATGHLRASYVAQESIAFLDKLLFKHGYLSLIGNKEWLTKARYFTQEITLETQESTYSSGQQPIEIPSLILLYKELYILTSNAFYKNRMLHTFEWFFGKNTLGLTLYDPISKGCSDGLDEKSKNKNQGAESVISFWSAHLYISTAFS
ncbi:hypothetical protein [Sphingobacterium sp. MYb382]|uniref:hypothetical protein n=1 Tax=Sphingobacterium sp. MYb382 TaxID=2745278 RepID=UPI0030ACA9C0